MRFPDYVYEFDRVQDRRFKTKSNTTTPAKPIRVPSSKGLENPSTGLGVVVGPFNKLRLSSKEADVFLSHPTVITLDHAEPPKSFFDPIIQLANPAIRISSLRMRGDSILLALYNLENQQVESHIDLAEYIKKASEVKLDRAVIRELSISNLSVNITFDAREVKMFRLDLS
ncbi:MAG: hypothetical protein JSW61_14865 [Candidatus Thorarchaeota archaeon]|nr:MAG: hypothetical protein JSW61_14865 [Candidatus Thorarchaeota archaeon]